VQKIKSTYYYPFGSPMQTRTWSSGVYRFGFNGQEKDDEIAGEGITFTYEYRIQDTRIGRFFSVDPKSEKFPWNSSYSFAENKVLQFIELEGLETAYTPATISAIIASGQPFAQYEYQENDGKWERRKQYYNVDANRFVPQPRWSSVGGHENQPPETGELISLTHTPRPFTRSVLSTPTVITTGDLSHSHGIRSAGGIMALANDLINSATSGDGPVTTITPNANVVIPLPATDARVEGVGGRISITNSTTTVQSNTSTTIDEIRIRGNWVNRRNIKTAAEQLKTIFPNAKVKTQVSLFGRYSLSDVLGDIWGDGCRSKTRVRGAEVMVKSTSTTTTTTTTTDTQSLSSNL